MSNLILTPVSSWFSDISISRLLIAGPCSAESPEQILETAKNVSEIKGVSVFRAGVWKPRTRPGSFEGRGVEALSWLKSVKQETNLKIAVEVAKGKHVEDCLKNEVDILWIGTRTTSNPFSVQEIADSLVGVDIPILVKNPLNPDLSLWIGALERINRVGIKKLAAVHRGFYPYEETPYRNVPRWEIPIELRSLFHDLPIICDPSHIAGNTILIQDIAQRALDMDMDGLMIETHIDPSKALSDAKQQLTPIQLDNMLKGLRHPMKDTSDQDFKDVLQKFRLQIDIIDNQMLELLSKRMDLVGRIGREKWEKNISVLQIDRWEKMRDTRLLLAKKLGLPELSVKKILQLIHKESIAKQTDIMRGLNKDNSANQSKNR